MSGQATGWVLRNGPKPTDVGADGKPYGGRARGLRAVLMTIADACNRDGEHGHPGVDAIVEGSLYSRSQALLIVGQLVEDGWADVEEEGGGRGKATVYCLPRMMAETVGFPDGSPGARKAETVRSGARNSPVSTDKQSGLSAKQSGHVGSDQGVSAPYGLDNGKSSTVEPNSAPPAPRPTDDPVKRAAHRLAVLAFEQPVKPVLREGGNAFTAVLGIIEAHLRAGRTVNDIEAAILAGVEVWTKAGLATSIAQHRTQRGRDWTEGAARAYQQAKAADAGEGG